MSKIKLAIVDGSLDMINEEKNYLTQNGGYDIVCVCNDGENAVEKITESGAEVVVLDLVLSSKDGFEVLEKIKQKKPSTKVVITTALVGDSFVHKAMQMGASDFVIKPFSMELLDKKINTLFREQSNILSQQAMVDSVVSGYQRINSSNRTLDEKISNIFITVGIPAHIKGYQFLREAIKMAVDSPEIVNSITKKLYPSIAERFGTSASKVERAIRHAIEVAWNRGKIENINSVFGLQVYGTNEKPTNGEFIALVADKMIIDGC